MITVILNSFAVFFSIEQQLVCPLKDKINHKSLIFMVSMQCCRIEMCSMIILQKLFLNMRVTLFEGQFWFHSDFNKPWRQDLRFGMRSPTPGLLKRQSACKEHLLPPHKNPHSTPHLKRCACVRERRSICGNKGWEACSLFSAVILPQFIFQDMSL